MFGETKVGTTAWKPLFQLVERRMLLTRSYISYSAVIDREINSEPDASSSKEPTALSATIIALRILPPVFLAALREPIIVEFQTLRL